MYMLPKEVYLLMLDDLQSVTWLRVLPVALWTLADTSSQTPDPGWIYSK